MEFTCKCGVKGLKTLGYEITPDSKCIDCISAEVKADQPRRKLKIESLVETLKQQTPLTHQEARTATTIPGIHDNPNLGHIYLSTLLGKDVPYYNYNAVYRVGEKSLVSNCVLNGYWPWARYKRDSGDFAYICLYIEP